jgi:hypothetical protein
MNEAIYLVVCAHGADEFVHETSLHDARRYLVFNELLHGVFLHPRRVWAIMPDAGVAADVSEAMAHDLALVAERESIKLLPDVVAFCEMHGAHVAGPRAA